MVRLIIAVTLTVLLVTLGASAQSNGAASVISVEATLLSVTDTGREARSDLLLLWNRDVRPTPIGHAAISCRKFHRDFAVGRNIYNCFGTYVLPLGKIAVQGIAHGLQRYTFVITGGTGAYVGKNGTMFSRRIGPGTLRVSFRLT